MKLFRFVIMPRAAFGTPLAGDTLFGQMCWTLQRQFGNARLDELLGGYLEGQPFAVLSDALPQGFLPLPTVPSSLWNAPVGGDRKALKKKRWLPWSALATPLASWQAQARSDQELAGVFSGTCLQVERAQPHNTINRATMTTGKDRFAPFAMSQIWHHPQQKLELYAVIDEARLQVAELQAALEAMGETGFGRDASIGLGKFSLGPAEAVALTPAANANAWLTLGPVAPQGLGFEARTSFYQSFTRFGRHGDQAVHLGNPFKRPVLLARGGGVFTPQPMKADRLFIGKGISGVSDVMPKTVVQGYAPVLAIQMPAGEHA